MWRHRSNFGQSSRDFDQLRPKCVRNPPILWRLRPKAIKNCAAGSRLKFWPLWTSSLAPARGGKTRIEFRGNSCIRLRAEIRADHSAAPRGAHRLEQPRASLAHCSLLLGGHTPTSGGVSLCGGVGYLPPEACHEPDGELWRRLVGCADSRRGGCQRTDWRGTPAADDVVFLSWGEAGRLSKPTRVASPKSRLAL